MPSGRPAAATRPVVLIAEDTWTRTVLRFGIRILERCLGDVLDAVAVLDVGAWNVMEGVLNDLAGSFGVWSTGHQVDHLVGLEVHLPARYPQDVPAECV